MRLPRPPPIFVPDDYVPQWQDFEPSTTEKAIAPVRISVWDSSLTTVSEARAFMNRPSIVVSANVATVKAAGSGAIVYEAIPSPNDAKPGAAGHAGIEGLTQGTGETRKARLDRLTRIASCFQLVNH
jgi:hypothetical protein